MGTGLDSDESFMSHDGQGVDTKSRMYVIDTVKKVGARAVAETGCGPLIDFKNAAANGVLSGGVKKYVGFDVTKRFIASGNDAAREIVKDEKVTTSIEFRLVDDPISFPAADMEFDLVYARHVLEHQPDYLRFLSELVRLSSKWVVLVFFMPPIHDIDGVDCSRHIIGIKDKDGFYYNTYSSDLLTKELSALGVSVVNKDILNDDGVINEAWVLEKA